MTDAEINQRISKAFALLETQWSVDRIIADSSLNELFIEACRTLELTMSVPFLNRRLMNLRKRAMVDRKSRSKRTSFPNEADYRFASEIAIRVLERRQSCSLDDVLCDPELAKQFDELANEIAPGYSGIQYRWAALNLRKSKQLSPEILGRVVQSAEVLRLMVDAVDLATLPSQQGLYIFHEARGTLYVGEAQHLRSRLKRHLDHSDNKGLARWLWENGSSGVFLEMHLLPPDTSTPIRRALETELIRSRRPLFNVQR